MDSNSSDVDILQREDYRRWFETEKMHYVDVRDTDLGEFMRNEIETSGGRGLAFVKYIEQHALVYSFGIDGLDVVFAEERNGAGWSASRIFVLCDITDQRLCDMVLMPMAWGVRERVLYRVFIQES